MATLEHYVRFGSHRETKVLMDPSIKKKIHGITLNANVVAHTPASIFRLLSIKFGRKDYFIDPQTYLVQFDPLKYYSTAPSKNKIQLKKSVETLVKEYGKPANRIIKSMQSLNPEDFHDVIDIFTDKVIKFQQNFMKKSFSEISEREGYDDYEEEHDDLDYPKYIIPPYFFQTIEDLRQRRGWLKLNEMAIKRAINKKVSNLAAEIVIEKQLLIDEGLRKQITDTYNALDIKTILLWIDEFKETEENELYFECLNKLINELNNSKNRRIINLYGGYFSIILMKKGVIHGICHGPGYGEYRGVKPIGGGIPTAKFYLPTIGNRIDFEQAFSILKLQDLFNEKYFDEICNCSMCKRLLGQHPDEKKFFAYGQYEMAKSGMREIPTEETLCYNQIHYLLNRLFDFRNFNLESEKLKFERFIKWNDNHRLVSTNHLKKWLKFM